MRIIDKFNQVLLKYIQSKTILFGQNISTGSRISGMTNFLDHLKKKVEIINTQNSENTLIGFGLGLALNGKKSLYFAKQLDFILLGIDHIVNTLNSLILENRKLKRILNEGPIWGEGEWRDLIADPNTAYASTDAQTASPKCFS
jgi:pyruvate/2-oxoglutarate/acetoin dehydrogenase E1 component